MTTVPRWYKSSYSTNQDTCVEVADLGSHVGVRDSKIGDASPVLAFAPAAFAAFLDSVKDGQLDG